MIRREFFNLLLSQLSCLPFLGWLKPKETFRILRLGLNNGQKIEETIDVGTAWQATLTFKDGEEISAIVESPLPYMEMMKDSDGEIKKVEFIRILAGDVTDPGEAKMEWPEEKYWKGAYPVMKMETIDFTRQSDLGKPPKYLMGHIHGERL